MDKWSDLEYSKCLIFKQIFEDIVSKGDYILIETPVYPGVTSVVSWLYITILHILPPVVCGRVHVLFALFCVCLRVRPTHIVFCFSSSFVSNVARFSVLSFRISPSEFSNVFIPSVYPWVTSVVSWLYIYATWHTFHQCILFTLEINMDQY
jgi:hypothetical protein